MVKAATRPHLADQVLKKCKTGIKGVDEITYGGLPKGRPTLICGGAGCGKTVFAMEFLYRGASEYNEPGVFMSFEENSDELIKNFSSLGFDLPGLIKQKKILLDYVFIERSEIEETGEYDLDGLFVRLGYDIDTIGAKRVVLDTVEALFSGFQNENILRSELRRLFRWLKTKGVTAVITGERGEKTFTRYGLEEYVADCVILLDHRVNEQMATRRMKIIKYRGSLHGTNEYPFLLNKTGFSVFPITSTGLNYKVSSQTISSGIKSLDSMLNNVGYYIGNTILVSGSAGTGKTSVVAHFVDAACRSKKQCVFFAFEESPNQIIRNMKNIGIDLQQWVDKGFLTFSANRPTHFGLEMHLLNVHDFIRTHKPEIVIFDPITNLITIGSKIETKTMLTRVLDYLKMNQITSMMTDLHEVGGFLKETEIGISSLCDTWIILQNNEENNERNRYISVLKSRGMKHSNSIKRYAITDKGIQIAKSSQMEKGGI